MQQKKVTLKKVTKKSYITSASAYKRQASVGKNEFEKIVIQGLLFTDTLNSFQYYLPFSSKIFSLLNPTYESDHHYEGKSL